MKLLLLTLLAATTFVQQKCQPKKEGLACYKGRLEVKGICANYTIAVLEGTIDTATIEASWTDENSGKTYRNVFALASACSFPDTINEGDTFTFTLSNGAGDCAVCQAFYPKPKKALAITVLQKPCN